jgi:ABC-2 type transport system permease protein
MPIYEQTYRRYEARAPLRTVRFWPITREALRLILARRAFLGLLLVAWVPVLWQVGKVYAVTQYPQFGRVLPIDGRMFGEFLSIQILFTLFISVFGGAGLIANDLRTGAILVYLSRPLTRRDYVLGKLGVLLALNLSVTLAPALVLYLISLGLAPEQLAKWDLAWIGPAIVVHSLVLALVVSLLALAASALARNVRVAGLTFFLLVTGLELIRRLVGWLYDRPESMLISIQGALQALGNIIFGTGRGAQLPWFYPALVLVVVSLACLAILRARVRAVEIVQ